MSVSLMLIIVFLCSGNDLIKDEEASIMCIFLFFAVLLLW